MESFYVLKSAEYQKLHREFVVHTQMEVGSLCCSYFTTTDGFKGVLVKLLDKHGQGKHEYSLVWLGNHPGHEVYL